MSDKVCRENYEGLLELPLVQKLIRKNKELRKRVKVLESIVYEFPILFHRRSVKSEPTIEPTLCDTLTDDDDEVRIIKNPLETPTIDLTSEEVLDPEPNIFIKIEKDEGVVAENSEATVEEEAEEDADADADADEEEADAEEEEADAEEEEEKKPEADDDTEVFEITIRGKAYYTNNETNGKIYSILPDEDVGPVVGKFVNGSAKFA